MAGYENIKDANFNRTPSERRELAKRAGIASGKARKQSAGFRKTLNRVFATEIDHPVWTPILESMGLESNVETAVNVAMIVEALNGNVKAYEAIAKYSGQSTQTEADDKEQEIRTDRAKRARDVEVGDKDSSEENIRDFLKAMNPTQEDLDALFAEEEVGNNAEEAEETGEV